MELKSNLANLKVNAALAVLAFAAGVVVTVACAVGTQLGNDQQLGEAVALEANRLADEAFSRVNLYQYGLRGARGAIHAAGVNHMSLAKFRDYASTRDLSSEFPGARGFGMVRRVSPADVTAYVESARADGQPDFAIHGFAPYDGNHYVIQYIEPPLANEGAVGLDIASEASRRAAATESMKLGEVRLTAPITLVQDNGKPQQSFLMLMPIYSSPHMPATEDERVATLFGWTYVPLAMREVLEGLPVDGRVSHLEFFDITDRRMPRQFYSGPQRQPGTAITARYSIERNVMGRVWQMQYMVYPGFAESLRQTSPWLVLMLGVISSLLFAVLLQLMRLNQWRRETVAAQQSQLAAIVETSADAILGLDLDGYITSWNRGAEQLFNYTAGDALGLHLNALIIPEAQTLQAQEVRDRVTLGQHTSSFQTIFKGRDRPAIPVDVTVAAIHDRNGFVVGTSKTIRDISAQQAAENRINELNQNLEAQVAQRTEELKALNAMFESILRAASEVSIIATDLNGMIQVFNPGAERMLGYRAAEMIGLQTPEIIHTQEALDDLNASVRDEYHLESVGINGFINQSALRESAQHYQCDYVRKDGTRFPVLLVVTAMHDHNHAPTGYLGIAIDMTAQRHLELNLQQAKEEADMANRAKSAFLANMSHEIRTPMNAVLGMLHLVLQTELGVGQHDYISKAQTAARLLLGLLNDILDYSKIEAGKLFVERLPFEIDTLLQDLAVVLAGNQTNKAVEIIFDIAPNLPAVVLGDRLRLQQILINLAGNALKFTTAGQIVLIVKEVSHTADQVTLQFSVVDSGIGMSPDQLRRIFEGFTQAEVSITRRFGGTGLGLLICKRLTGLMGSELKVESHLHAGSRFWFDLTLDIGPTQQTGPRDLPSELNVLVVDDHPIAGEILLRALQGQGWRAQHVHSAEDALAELQNAQARGDRYQMVLMDWRLPGMDGLTAAHQIKALDNLQPSPPVVMITAYGSDALAREHGKEQAPFAGVLTKPVTLGQLARAVSNAYHGVAMLAHDARVKAADRPQRLAGLNLLLVEDNKVNQLVASAMLRGEGATVEIAVGGMDGVHKVMTSPLPYHVVLMDVQMPDIDGFEATRLIRAQPRYQSLPIVAMTANVSEADREECFAAGMDDHVGKPIDLDQLVRVLLEHV